MRRARPSRHLAFHHVLESLRESRGCPLCALEMQAVRRYLGSLLHESVNDAQVRAALKASRGFCGRHAKVLSRSGSALGVAILYEDQLRNWLDEWAGAGSSSRLRPAPAARAECPACVVQRESRRRAFEVLLASLDEPDVSEAIRSCPPLCVPHFSGLMTAAGGASGGGLLREIQRSKMEQLLHDLQEFRRKNDYRFRDEGFGRESDAWLRAVRVMNGEEDVL